MKKMNKKRGFTILELTIVISVIAILSAVLIPVFAGITKKAKMSADEQAVANMNTALIGADDSVDTPDEAIEFLAGEGYVVSAPLSKDYSFVYCAEENKVLLYSYKENKVVYPKAYADCDCFKTLINDKGEKPVDATDANAFANNSIVAVKGPLTVAATIDVTKDLVVDLTGTIQNTNTNDDTANGVFQVKDGAKLTLNGTGTVNAVNGSHYPIAVWANGGDVVITGGTYTNWGCGTDNQYDLIYAKNGGKITITGGSFKCQTPGWTINNNNVAEKPGTVVIKGGEFFEFNPSADVVMPDGRTHAEDGILLADGYVAVPEVRADGTWYVVKPAA